MAIISIPSSIGGVAIPGLTTNGPLGLLFNNPFSQTNLQYPRDLQSTARGHYVTFLIKDINPVGYEEGTEYTIGGGIANAVTNEVNEVVTSVKDFFNGTEKQASAATIAPETTTPRGSISLYIPETVNFSYGASYNDVSLTAVVGDTVSSALGTVGKHLSKASEGSKAYKLGQGISSLGNIASADAAKLALRQAGLAVNPKLQLLFEGIGFRSYQMTFTFTPYSQQESEQVTKIINTFKKFAAPRIVSGATAGLFFIPPAVFEPKFYFNGAENKKINAIAQSVIENIDVNYAPNGWSTFGDGAPVQTTLTIQFKETQILDRDTLVTGNY
jgi:hypothetical protein